VSVAVIETIENRYAGRPYRVELVFPEYTSICPLTGAPDFGNTQRMRIH
jgi:7-cyano-7-deazaguanine reductase